MFIQFEKIGSATTRGNGSNAPAAPYTNATHSNSSSPRRGANTSVLSWGKLRLWGLAAKKLTSRLFLTARATFKFSQFAQAVLDVFAASYWLLYVALWIVVILGILPFALFCLFLIQF